MDNYLVDRGTLEQFVDELIKKKPLPVDNAEELNKLREDSIKALDDKIGVAIFGSLSDEQNEELRQILERDDGSSDEYEEFFKRAGIDIEKIISETGQKFAEEFLGGQNA